MKKTPHQTRWRTALAVVGAAAVLAAGADSIAFAATGDSLLLGKTNKAGKTTTVKSAKGPALSLKTKKNAAPFAVSSNKKVAKLNADAVDGLGAAQLEPPTYRVVAAPRGVSVPLYAYRTFKLPPGRYQVGMSGLWDMDNGTGSWTCLAGDYQLLLANDVAGLYAVDTGDETSAVSANALATVGKGRTVIAGCRLDGPGTPTFPATITFRAVNGVSDVAGTPFTPRKVSKGSSLLAR